MSEKYTEKKKASNKRYKEKLTRVDVWLTPEEKNVIKEVAKAEKKSISSYFRSKAGLKETPLGGN